MGGFAYLLGRKEDDLLKLITDADQTASKAQVVDKIFAGVRLDDVQLKRIGGASFAHCTFANVGFKDITLDQVNFEDCAFIGCYFRKSRWTGCRFQSCRFIDSQIQRVEPMNCTFFYTRFLDCFIPFNRVKSCLPSQPNLRKDLAHNLALEAAKAGYAEEARKFRWCELEALETHLKNAIRQDELWYQTHYATIGRRLGALTTLTASVVNRCLWGYGDKAHVLLINLGIIVFLIFPFAFYLLREDLGKPTGVIGLSDYIYLSVEHILMPTIASSVNPHSWALWMTSLEGFVGIVIAGLFVSYLFQWIVRR